MAKPEPPPDNQPQVVREHLSYDELMQRWHRKSAKAKGDHDDPTALRGKCDLLRFLQEFLEVAPPGVQLQFIRESAEIFKTSTERFRKILLLRDEADWRAAIKAKPLSQHRRMPGDEVYPTEGWLGRYLLWTQSGEAPLAFHFWAGMAVLSAACRRSLYLYRGNHRIWPNQYIILVGSSGTKKSTAIGHATDLVYRLNEHIEAAQLTDPIPTDRSIRLLANKFTNSALIQEMKQDQWKTRMVNGKEVKEYADSVGYISVSELADLLGAQTFDPGQIVVTLTDLWDCPSMRVVSTKGDGPRTLYKVSLTFLAGTTPDWVRAMDPSIMAGGFTSRCNFVYRPVPKKIVAEPDPMDPLIADQLAEELLEIAMLPYTVEVDPTREANEWFRHWYVEWRRGQDDVVVDRLMAGYVQRRDVHLWKMALLLCISKGEFPRLGIETLRQALTILEHEEQFLPMCFAEIGRHPANDDIEWALAQLFKHGGRVPMMKLGRIWQSRLPLASQRAPVLATLKENGRVDVEIVPSPTGKGRGSQWVVANHLPFGESVH